MSGSSQSFDYAAFNQGLAERKPSCNVIIKNTFIEFDLCQGPHPGSCRRSSSEPCLRLAEDEFAEDEWRESEERPRHASYEPASGPTGAKGSVEESEGSTDASSEISLQDLTPSSSEASPREHPPAQPKSPSAPSGNRGQNVLVPPSQAMIAGALVLPSMLSAAMCAKPPPPPPPPSAETWLGLRSAARPWAPTANPVPTPKLAPGAKAFADQMRCIMDAIVARMQKSVNIPVQVHVVEERRGWSVFARVHEANLPHFQQLLAGAKAVVMRATDGDADVRLLGHGESPFKAKLRGFGATFVSMQDRSRACWDFYTTGACERGDKCRWEHPACKARVYVAVRLLSEMSESTED